LNLSAASISLPPPPPFIPLFLSPSINKSQQRCTVQSERELTARTQSSLVITYPAIRVVQMHFIIQRKFFLATTVASATAH
jgi:hypothetical protein